MAKKRKLIKLNASDWIGLGGLIVNVVLILFTYFALQEARKSTNTAQDALTLQQQQYNDLKDLEKLKSSEDSDKRRKDIELVEQQISALQSQADALNRSIRNSEVSQRPYLDVAQFGFHSVNEKHDLFIWQYYVENYGSRPVVLKSVKTYFFDSQYKYIQTDTNSSSMVLVKTRKLRACLEI